MYWKHKHAPVVFPGYPQCIWTKTEWERISPRFPMVLMHQPLSVLKWLRTICAHDCTGHRGEVTQHLTQHRNEDFDLFDNAHRGLLPAWTVEDWHCPLCFEIPMHLSKQGGWRDCCDKFSLCSFILYQVWQLLFIHFLTRSLDTFLGPCRVYWIAINFGM